MDGLLAAVAVEAAAGEGGSIVAVQTKVFASTTGSGCPRFE
jgi:hypothetical protein